MAPYSPPTGDRVEKLRLDFNENTVGCSPRVIDALKRRLTEESLTVYPTVTSPRRTLSGLLWASHEGGFLSVMATPTKRFRCCCGANTADR